MATTKRKPSPTLGQEKQGLNTVLADALVEGKPQPKGSMRGFVHKGRAVLTTANKGLKPWTTRVVKELKKSIWLDEPYPYAVRVSIYASFVPPKSRSSDEPMIQKPDIDKVARAVLDAIVEAGVICDDKQVVFLMVSKRYSETGTESTEICVRSEGC